MPDRLATLLTSTAWNGIDFVEVASDDQTHLVVHFLNDVTVSGTLTGPTPVRIGGGEAIASVPLAPITAGDWTTDDAGRPLLALTTSFVGDFSTYVLSIESSVLDPYYARVPFSFKARCPSGLDCAQPCIHCPEPAGPTPAIDYLAKDFNSFKRALSEYSAVAYPDWVERSEADLGVMLMELIAATGDDLSYLQDRIAAEATLETATQRRSVIRHARLVDYEPRPAVSARALIQIDVASGPLQAGALLHTASATEETIWFSLGPGLIDPRTGEEATAPLIVDPRWNGLDAAGAARIVPYWWDDAARCLPAGATEMWVRGHGFAFATGDVQLGTVGLALLIDTTALLPIDAPIREVVHLTDAVETTDPLFGDAITRIAWSEAEAVRFEHDLTRTTLAGNLVPATEGRGYTDQFVVDPALTPASATAVLVGPEPAVVRAGPNAECADGSPIYLRTLPRGRVAWLVPEPGPLDVTIPGQEPLPLPEILLVTPPTPAGEPERPWRWRRRLLDAAPFEAAFTLEPSRFSDVRVGADRVVGAPRWEYDGDDADSIRFGDGVFGERPASGSPFEVRYRVTSGAAGNVAADTISGVDPAMAGLILRATNPFPAIGGADEETSAEVRRRAPFAFRSRKLRAVRAEDYNEQAEQLPWVLDAGTAFRWTGSWLTVFTTAQARGTATASIADRVSLVDLLDRRRLAGYEVYTPAPRYVDLDLIVIVCAQPWAFRGEVEAGIRTELGTGRRADGKPAFFAPDQFRFGMPLERSALEIAIQRVTGVQGVVAIRVRRRGSFATFRILPETLTVGRDQIVRVDNDPSFPEHGSLRIVVEGGK